MKDGMQLTPAQFLGQHRVFTRHELLAALTASGRNAAAVQSSLEIWMRDGRLRSVKRGVFVKSGIMLERADYLALGARLAPDAALAHQSALDVHGWARSHVEDVLFATRTKFLPLTFDQRLFTPVRPRAGLAVPERVLAELKRVRPARPVYMRHGRPGKLAKRWNLLVPEALIQEERNALV